MNEVIMRRHRYVICIAALEHGVEENCIADELCVGSEAKIVADAIAQKQCLSRREARAARNRKCSSAV